MSSGASGAAAGDAPVVLITGGARGIGRGLVDGLNAAGWRVCACDILSPLPASTPTVRYMKCDVREEAEVRAFVDDAAAYFGRIDGVVNNAALANPYLDYKRFEDIDTAAFKACLDVNLVGTMLVMKHAVPHLRRTGGSVVNISSTRARMSEPKCEAYAASKGGVESLTHAAAVSLQGDGVRVNGVAPGWINVVPAEDYAPTAADHAFHPVGRVGTADDIVGAVAFLLDCTKAGFITGQTLTVDGGVTRKMIYPEDEEDDNEEDKQ